MIPLNILAYSLGKVQSLHSKEVVLHLNTTVNAVIIHFLICNNTFN